MPNKDLNQPRPKPGVLKLKKRDEPEQALKSTSTPTKIPSQKQRRARKSSSSKRTRSTMFRILGLTLAPCVLGLLVFGIFIAHQVLEWEILSQDQVLLTRNITLAAFLAVIILEAFTEDLLQGILCLFLLPYSFIYGLFFADAGPIRGLTIAFLVFLGAEMYFTPDDAFVPKAQQVINEWIKTGQDKLIYPDGRPEAGFE